MESRDQLHPEGDYTRSDGPEPWGGAYQFSLTTWAWIGFSGLPSQSSPETQDRAAVELYRWSVIHQGNGFAMWQTAPSCGL